MLTQKNNPATMAAARGPKIRTAGILVEGFVPQKTPQERFDLGAGYRSVALFLADRGFRMENCADHTGLEFHGGELSGTPWNACMFDVFTDMADSAQSKLSVALRILADAREFRGTVSASGGERWALLFEGGAISAPGCLEYLLLVERAELVEVSFRYGGKGGSFGI